ncbi:MAG: hypothetical protein GY749_28230 [Desulfobacteraceae bacterium]|nr:hypothetical protein [Desulfobacteraceae bacterium]
MLEAIPILVLNELSDEMHNAFIKCFASRKKAKKSAFETLTRHGLFSFGRQFKLVMDALMHFWFSMKGDDMKEELTFEKATEIGKLLEKSVLSSLSPKERLKGLKPEERMKGLKPEERMKGLKPEERLEGLKPKERLKGLKPEERMEGLKPEERIAGLSVKEVEACLKKLKKKRSPDN